MLFEYAVDPEAIGSSWGNFRYLIEKFGFDRGRLISRLPAKWEKKVIQAAKEAGVPDIQLASIVERLRKTKLSVVASGRIYNSEMSWIDNALAENRRTPFHAIIAQKNSSEISSVLPVADIDEYQPLMVVTQDRAVSRRAEDIAAALNFFLRVSNRILFVDPFFDPYNARYKKTIRACLAVVKKENSGASCEIHYRYHSNKPTNAELEREAAGLFNDMIPEGLAVSLYCWREKNGGKDFHARYLLTELGGVSIDAGFSAEGGHQTTDMHLMSADLSRTRFTSFARDATDFELIEPVLVISSNGNVSQA